MYSFLLDDQENIWPEFEIPFETFNFEDDLNQLSLENQEDIASEMQMKTITMKEYADLMKLKYQTKKYEDIIEMIRSKIKLKDAQIRGLKNILAQDKSINISHLSNVSKN